MEIIRISLSDGIPAAMEHAIFAESTAVESAVAAELSAASESAAVPEFSAALLSVIPNASRSSL